MEDLKLLHIGCANRYYPGFINSDMRTEWKGKKNKLDLVMDISKPWPYENDSIDGIVSMHVLQQLYWRELIFGLREAYRVLKTGGVFRFGCPTVDVDGRSIDYILGWNNINLFDSYLLKQVFSYHLGFSRFSETMFHVSALPVLATIDNREDRGTKYYEAIK